MIHSMLHRLHNTDLGILLIRIAIGVVFINAGWLKVSSMEQVVTGFGSIGIPAFLAYFVAYAEFLGGILFVLGLFVRYVGVITSVIMLVALFKVHFVNGFSLANGGYEYVLVLLLGSLAMVTLGAGSYSLAHYLKLSK
ncbi:DoxX family protein [Candidatus Nomurabacteria bacterium]|nr:DoxX family protein [Candidatus Nomurabacteria bacterium]